MSNNCKFGHENERSFGRQEDIYCSLVEIW